MIELYSWGTPNGRKIPIMLEEAGLAYETIAVNIGKGEQFAPDFLRISPNNKVPAIVDLDGPGGVPISIFESGAILIYLAEKSGMFLPNDPHLRYSTLEWLMFQMGGIGPLIGQAHHFRHYAPDRIDYAIDRYTNEASRLYGVMDRRLSGTEYLAADEITIADFATFPWIRSHERHGQKLDDFANVKRWFDSIAERPGVVRGNAALDQLRTDYGDSEVKETMFGKTQYEKR